MRARAKPPRRKWPWIIVGIILAALAVYAIYAVATNAPQPTASPTPTVSTEAPSAAPTGCLVGPDLDAATLIATQDAATHDSNGAVEVAAALMRWSYRYPYPSADDADAVSDVVISSEAPDSFRDLAGFFSGSPNLSGGIVPDATDYRLSTITGVWNLESEEEDLMTVSVGANFVVDDQISSSLTASTTVTLRWEDGAWRADQLAATRTTEELFQIGTPFTGGC